MSAATRSALITHLHRQSLADQRYREFIARALGIGVLEATAMDYIVIADSVDRRGVERELDMSEGGASALVERLERKG